MKLCKSCEMKEVKSVKARYCDVCSVALAKYRAEIAVYRHRERKRRGIARHNTSYGGQPTKWMRENLTHMTLGDILVSKPELAVSILRNLTAA